MAREWLRTARARPVKVCCDQSESATQLREVAIWESGALQSHHDRDDSIIRIYDVNYEWDAAKNALNQRKHHGISFDMAAFVFEDHLCLLVPGQVDETGEQRWIAVGAVQIEPGASAVPPGCSRLSRRCSWRRNHPRHLGPSG